MNPVIGLTGLAASGKSLAASYYKLCGAHVIDVDKLGHRVLEESGIKDKLREVFGEIISTSGEIDRKLLGREVFSDESKLAELEIIVHPRMCELARKEIAQNIKSSPVVLDAALLFAMGLDEDCDRIALVEAPIEMRIKFAQSRGWSSSELEKRDARISKSLRTVSEKLFVINNIGTPKELGKKVIESWKDIENGNKKESY